MRNENSWPTSVVHLVGCTQIGPKEPAHVSKAQIQRTSARGRGLGMGNQPLFISNQRTTGDPYKRTKPLRMN